ncbi:MAG: hypothetical protein OES47_02020 [Acidobacteriota bacterium]|nr:hypothetical protein [Acidobacteriota bacterium]
MRCLNRELSLVCMALLMATSIACGPKGPAVNEAAEAEWALLSEADGKLDSLREELAGLEEAAGAEPVEGEEAPADDLAAQIEEKKSEIESTAGDFLTRIGNYLNEIDPMFADEPATERQLAVIRMKSDEDILLGGEWIEEGGDYKKAISIFTDALELDPDNESLKAVLASAEEMRFMTEERLGQVAKGMSPEQVREMLGPVNLRNIREYPERKVVAWFYPVNEKNEASAVWFRKNKSDELVVYRTNFEEVRGQGEGEG